MVAIGIDEGDLILVKKTETAGTSDVVVALTERGNTLKRFILGERQTAPPRRKQHLHRRTNGLLSQGIDDSWHRFEGHQGYQIFVAI